MTGSLQSATVTDNADESRYEVAVDGQRVGFVTYYDGDGCRVLTHTEVLPGHVGHGIGGQLAHNVLEDLLGRGLFALPYCPFIRDYIARHRRYLGLVPENERPKVGL